MQGQANHKEKPFGSEMHVLRLTSFCILNNHHIFTKHKSTSTKPYRKIVTYLDSSIIGYLRGRVELIGTCT